MPHAVVVQVVEYRGCSPSCPGEQRGARDTDLSAILIQWHTLNDRNTELRERRVSGNEKFVFKASDVERLLRISVLCVHREQARLGREVRRHRPRGCYNPDALPVDVDLVEIENPDRQAVTRRS